MTLEPGIAALVQDFINAGRPSARHQPIEERRAGYIAAASLSGDSETRVSVEERTLQGRCLRIYSPLQAPSNVPAIVYYHGGCFVSGGFATHDNTLRQLAYHSQCRVIAVQYRLAPEHRYPAAHDDAFQTFGVIQKQAKTLQIDAANLVLMGDSAGGHLAFITTLRLRDRGGLQPRGQVLIYPMLDATARCDTYRTHGDDFIITRDALLTGYEAYFAPSEYRHPEASPLWRHDLNDLPQTLIITAEYDPLRDEGEQLYRTLVETGVSARCKRYLGVIHGFFQLGGISQAARDVMQDIASNVRQMVNTEED
ncbi:alpha/beta hydrolase [Lonsdalea quercina]|uniref:alpha/beta hydrolase n=1 Tax=Lonsdalea quercina TaxID=71657 RepID=UPI0039770E09